MAKFCAFLLIALLAMAIVGHFRLIPENQKPKLDALVDRSPGEPTTAFVLVHGLDGPKGLENPRTALLDHGDILRLQFKPIANVSPNDLADAMICGVQPG